MIPTEVPRWYTVPELAARWHVSPRTVWRWLAAASEHDGEVNAENYRITHREAGVRVGLVRSDLALRLFHRYASKVRGVSRGRVRDTRP